METREVKLLRIKPTSLAMFEGLFTALVAFFVSVAAWIGLTAHYTTATNSLLNGLLLGLAPGLGAVILGTIIYFAIGWIFGIIHGALFNMAAGWMGGLEMTRGNYDDESPAVQRSTATRRAEPSFGETVDHRRIDR